MNVLKFKSFDENMEGTSSLGGEISKRPVWESVKDSDNSQYLQEYLKNTIGRYIKADFLLGDDNLISKEGILKEVGTDYIVLEMIQSNDLLVCDIYSIKFVQII